MPVEPSMCVMGQATALRTGSSRWGTGRYADLWKGTLGEDTGKKLEVSIHQTRPEAWMAQGKVGGSITSTGKFSRRHHHRR